VSAPVVLSVEPANSETDVILGTPIFVTFDQEIDATTVNDATFCLTGPGTSEVVTAQNMATLSSLSPTGREYITGTFGFVLNSNNRTVVTFTPSRILRKNTTYDVLILGSSGSLVSNGVKNTAGEALVDSYEWTFTTGTVDLTLLHTWSLPPAGNHPPRARRRRRHPLRSDSLLLLIGQDDDAGEGWDPLCSPLAARRDSNKIITFGRQIPASGAANRASVGICTKRRGMRVPRNSTDTFRPPEGCLGTELTPLDIARFPFYLEFDTFGSRNR
jgi:Bacterial Ig-like domain